MPLSCKLSTPNGLVDPYKNAIDITNFVAQAASTTSVSLTWTMPAGSAPTGIKILRKTGSFPANIGDGTVVYDGLGTSATDANATVNTQYYYTAFAYSWVGLVSAGVSSAAYPNNQLPTVTASTPADTATGIAPCSSKTAADPCRAKIILQFSESMNSTLTQILTTGIHDGTSFVSAPNTNTTFVWSSTLNFNDTLTINISWHWFTENSQIQYTLPAANLQDNLNNAIDAQVQRSFTTTTAKQSFVLSDTGQTGCSDNTITQTCPFASHPGQDADFVNVPNARSFTGPTAHATYATDFTTTDNVTALVWKSCSEGQTSNLTCNSNVPAATTATWYNALNQCSALNSANSSNGYAGRTTWRLPTQRELETLPNFNVSSPAINTANFPATVSAAYWSSSAVVGSLTTAWYVFFNNGSATVTVKSNVLYVRCVATGPSITPVTYTDNGDGTVTDATTALRWQKCSRGQNNDATCSGVATTANLQTALQYCDTLTLGSFANASNWRLPNYNELMSLVDKSVSSPAINTANFPATVSFLYWSSSAVVGSLSLAWYVTFANGSASSNSKTSTYSVRCVASP